MRTLFITTANHIMDDRALRKAPLSGHLFTARFDSKGMPSPSPSSMTITETEDRS